MASKWGWFASIYHLAGGDVLKIEAVTELKIEQALTFLCYELDLSISKKNKDIIK
jgi:hypothetical protein|tara:strand:- start:1443 stop:1607 length:165 start_codon:yes stop_codon:yes gene_type:complete